MDLALVLHDAWHPYVHQKAEKLLQPAGIPWLRGFVSFGEGVIGPLVRPGTRGAPSVQTRGASWRDASEGRCGSCR